MPPIATSSKASWEPITRGIAASGLPGLITESLECAPPTGEYKLPRSAATVRTAVWQGAAGDRHPYAGAENIPRSHQSIIRGPIAGVPIPGVPGGRSLEIFLSLAICRRAADFTRPMLHLCSAAECLAVVLTNRIRYKRLCFP